MVNLFRYCIKHQLIHNAFNCVNDYLLFKEMQYYTVLQITAQHDVSVYLIHLNQFRLQLFNLFNMYFL